jgi:hypothetical protein
MQSPRVNSTRDVHLLYRVHGTTGLMSNLYIAAERPRVLASLRVPSRVHAVGLADTQPRVPAKAFNVTRGTCKVPVAILRVARILLLVQVYVQLAIDRYRDQVSTRAGKSQSCISPATIDLYRSYVGRHACPKARASYV